MLNSVYECLIGFIGLKSCQTGEQPASGFYVNALPGITNDLLGSITDGTENNYIETWITVQRTAIVGFYSLFVVQVNNCRTVKNQQTLACLICESRDILSIALWYYMGHQVCVEALNSSSNSRYSTTDREVVTENRDYLLNQAMGALKSAISSIDFDNSPCICKAQECVRPNGAIHYRDSYM